MYEISDEYAQQNVIFRIGNFNSGVRSYHHNNMYMNSDMKPTDMPQIVLVWSAIIFKNLTALKINKIIQMSGRSQKDAYNLTDQ